MYIILIHTNTEESIPDTYDVLVSEEMMETALRADGVFAHSGFINTCGQVTRCGFFEKGSNMNNFESRQCDMDKLKFLLIWCDNKQFSQEIEGKFVLINKNNPQIDITMTKSLLSDEKPLFQWNYENIDSPMYDSVQIHDLLFIFGVSMINSKDLVLLLPPFDTIKTLILNMERVGDYIELEWDRNSKLSSNDYNYEASPLELLDETNTYMYESVVGCFWDNKTLELLVYGYIRRCQMLTDVVKNNYNFVCNDLSIIVINYLKSMFFILSSCNVYCNGYNSILCSFNVGADSPNDINDNNDKNDNNNDDNDNNDNNNSDENNNNDDDDETNVQRFATAVITPTVSQLIENKIKYQQSKTKSIRNNHDYDGDDIVSLTMRIMIRKLCCLRSDLSDYNIEFGIIGIPKYTKKDKNIKNIKKNKSNKNTSNDENNPDDSGCYGKFYTLTTLAELVKDRNFCLSDISSKTKSINHDNIRGGKCFATFMKAQDKIDMVDSDSSSTSCSCSCSSSSSGDCNSLPSDKIGSLTLYENSQLKQEFYGDEDGCVCLEENMGNPWGLQVVIEKNNDGKGICTFYAQSQQCETRDRRKSVTIDFDKFDYLFALSSRICHCHQGLRMIESGFQFEILIE